MGTEATRTQLFVLRLWREEAQPPHTPWRGSITYTATGETRYFRDPATLYEALQRMLADHTAGDDPTAP